MKKHTLTLKELYSHVAEATGYVLEARNIKTDTSHFAIEPFKSKYLFHTQNLRGIAMLLIFDLKELSELNHSRAILKGDVLLGKEALSGKITVNKETGQVSYKYKNRSPQYRLLIDPSSKNRWEKLLEMLNKR